jgi:type II secretory ATPase GspE/PulE/Tfp pilus assembly ATPase PilB-like protein
VLPTDAELRRLIARDPNLEAIRQWRIDHNHATLLECGLRLAEAETTSLEEVARVAFFE